jgi:hypothetical protein
VLCRAAFSQRTAKKMHVKKNILLCGFPLVHGKHFFTPPDGTPFDNRQLFVPFVVHQKGARQRHTLCRCLPCVSRRRTTNIYLCRVFSYGARQNIYKKIDFCTSFDFSTTKILFCTLLQHVMHHVKIW